MTIPKIWLNDDLNSLLFPTAYLRGKIRPSPSILKHITPKNSPKAGGLITLVVGLTPYLKTWRVKNPVMETREERMKIIAIIEITAKKPTLGMRVRGAVSKKAATWRRPC